MVFHEPWRESTLPRLSPAVCRRVDRRGEWNAVISDANTAHKKFFSKAVPRSKEPFLLERTVLRRAAMQTDLNLDVPHPAKTLLSMVEEEGRFPVGVKKVLVNKCTLGGAEGFHAVAEAAKEPAVVTLLPLRPDVIVFPGDDAPLEQVLSVGNNEDEDGPVDNGANRSWRPTDGNKKRRTSSFYKVDVDGNSKSTRSMSRARSFVDTLCGEVSDDGADGGRDALLHAHHAPLSQSKDPFLLGFAEATGARDMALQKFTKLCNQTVLGRRSSIVSKLRDAYKPPPQRLIVDATPFQTTYNPIPHVERLICDRAFGDNDDYLYLTHEALFHEIIDRETEKEERRRIAAQQALGSSTRSGSSLSSHSAGDDDNDDDADGIGWTQHDRGNPAKHTLRVRMKNVLRQAKGKTPSPHCHGARSVEERRRVETPGTVAVVPHTPTPQPAISDRLLLLSMPPKRKILKESKTCVEHMRVVKRIQEQAQQDALQVRRVDMPIYLNLNSFV